MRFLKLLLNTLFPPVCVSCKREGDFLCIDCLKRLDKKKIKTRYQKYRDPDIHYLNGVIYALDYAQNPQIKAAVRQFKYRFTQDLAGIFADMIAEKIGELAMVKGCRIVLIPVPLHKKRLNERGFNQADVIARAVADRLPEANVLPLLERVCYTSQQAKLDKKGRHENLKEAFKIRDSFCHPERSRRLNKKCVHNFDTRVARPNVPYRYGQGPLLSINGGKKERGKKKLNKKETERKKIPLYFLVDDIFTTGATLENCARVLKESGFKKVYGLVVARALKMTNFKF